MADYYTLVSFEVRASREEADYAKDLYSAIEEAIEDGGGGEIVEFSDDTPEQVKADALEFYLTHIDEPVIGFNMEEQRCGEDIALWFSVPGEGNIDMLCEFVEHLVIKFSWPPVIFHWSNTCSKPRTDAYGGGACIITKKGVHYMNTYQWATQKLLELEFTGDV